MTSPMMFRRVLGSTRAGLCGPRQSSGCVVYTNPGISALQCSIPLEGVGGKVILAEIGINLVGFLLIS